MSRAQLIPCGICGDEEADRVGNYLGPKCYMRLLRIHEKVQGNTQALDELRDEAQLELAIIDVVADPPAALRRLFEAWDAKLGPDRRLIGLAGGLE